MTDLAAADNQNMLPLDLPSNDQAAPALHFRELWLLCLRCRRFGSHDVRLLLSPVIGGLW